MTTITQSITALPTAPSRSQDPATFITNANAHVAALSTLTTQINTWAGQANTVAGEVNTNASNAATSESNASASESAAEISAANAATAAGVTKWVSGTSYTEGDVVWAPSDFQTYRRRVTGGGTTDPASDAPNWALITLNLKAWAVKTTTYTALNGDRLMCDTTSGVFTVTLPASPVAGYVVTVSDYANKFGTNNLTVARNSSKIMGLTEDFICDMIAETRTFEYIDSTQGWRVI